MSQIQTTEDSQRTSNRTSFRSGGSANTPKRSKKGCPECRKRKIKCDEKQPRCGQCHKSGRSCRIQDAIFREHALTFIAAGNPPNDEPQDTIEIVDDGPDYAMHDTEPAPNSRDFAEHSLLLQQFHRQQEQEREQPPQHETSVQADPYAAASINSHSQMQHEHQQQSLTPVFDALSNMVSPVAVSYVASQASGSTPAAQSSTIQNREIRYTASLTPGGTPAAHASIVQDRDEDEENFLLRLYAEGVGTWMDTPPSQKFFSQELCKLAKQHPLLCFSACAVAAKRSGQLGESSAKIVRSNGQVALARKLLRGDRDYLWYGAKYHEKALQLLARRILRNDTPSVNTSPADSARAGSVAQSFRIEDEDPVISLLAVCLLTQYEHLNATMRAWWGHLNGFNKMLHIIDAGAFFTSRSLSHDMYPFSSRLSLVQAAFWYFALHDLDESYVSHKSTRIDTDNIFLWRNAGLLLDDEGMLITDLPAQGLSTVSQNVGEELYFLMLVRVLFKVVNHQASLAKRGPTLTASRLGLSSSTMDIVGNFASIETEFDLWVEGLPTTFRPDARWRDTRTPPGMHTAIIGQETWFATGLQALTMMYYHMGRILLLTQRPAELALAPFSTATRKWPTQFDLLATCRSIQQQMYNHAAEIMSIVAGMPSKAVRSRAIQPLYAAGRCLLEKADRRYIVKMLRSIQDDLGLATEYRVEDLLQEWEITCDSLGLEPRPLEDSTLTTFGDYSRDLLALEALQMSAGPPTHSTDG